MLLYIGHVEYHYRYSIDNNHDHESADLKGGFARTPIRKYLEENVFVTSPSKKKKKKHSCQFTYLQTIINSNIQSPKKKFSHVRAAKVKASSGDNEKTSSKKKNEEGTLSWN